MSRTRPGADGAADDIDLNPLIDVVTILIVFFIFGGRLDQASHDQITVPPGRTGTALRATPEWEDLAIDVVADRARDDGAAMLTIGDHRFRIAGPDDWAPVRALLDRVWDHAGKIADPSAPARSLPRVTLELRADADAPYRVVQELEQVAADTFDATPAASDTATSRRPAATPRPFPSLAFAVRPVGG